MDQIDRIVVVGAGKAGTGMSRGLIQAFESTPWESRISGWVNVPDDCVADIPGMTIHAARPAGVNEPTEAGLRGTTEIVNLLENTQPHDLCICLISGGGSALMPAPINGIHLEDKQHITRLLSSGGANIQQLNSVRKKLSQIKGGQLVSRCGSPHFVSLVISDVLGDPLDIIASGPTVADTEPLESAISVIHQLLDSSDPVVDRCLAAMRQHVRPAVKPIPAHVEVIGNNRTAVEAAVAAAKKFGYETSFIAHRELEGAAEQVGFDLARQARDMVRQGGKRVYVSGGEPTVELAEEDIRGKGGRNQQLVLAALANQIAHATADNPCMKQQIILSGGTDGEDGPTDMAGAWIDADIAERYEQSDLDIKHFLKCNDAYHFFQQLGGLLKTGPTHTNVCDVRVVATNSMIGTS